MKLHTISNGVDWIFMIKPFIHVIVIIWLLDLQLPMQSVPITTNVESSNPTQVRWIKFVSDLWQVGGFPRVLRFPPPIKLTTKI
jgi:hypothetical protein